MIYKEKVDLFGNVTREIVNEETGKISKLKFIPEIVKIESFTDKGIFYEIDKKNCTCSCPAFQKQSRKMCKHLKKVLFDKEPMVGFSISLLKSAEQKAVRRGDVNRAVKCAKIHLKKDCNDFWRRLAIIVLEDVVLHPDYKRIVDLSLDTSKKTYIQNKEDDEFGIGIIEQLARCEWRDFDYKDYLKTKSYDTFEKFESLSDKEKELINAIKLRAKLGGMSWDMNMLNGLAVVWTYRFFEKEYTVEDLEKMYSKPQIKYDEISDKESEDDILTAAVDFHCSPILNILLKKPQIVNFVNNIYPDFEAKLILEKIVWKERSAVSYKKNITNKQVVDHYQDKTSQFLEEHRDRFGRIYEFISNDLENISKW
ncbi:MAG: SWIM zinc finger family protein, partial [Candidatus Magasanikiibacteriota bacterium]